MVRSALLMVVLWNSFANLKETPGIFLLASLFSITSTVFKLLFIDSLTDELVCVCSFNCCARIALIAGPVRVPLCALGDETLLLI